MSKQTSPFLQNSLLFILVALLAVTIFYYSGRATLPLLFIELSGATLLLLAGWSVAWRGQLNTITWLLVLFGTLLPWLYLIPVTHELWLQLAGHAHYENTLQWLQTAHQTEPYLAISLIPYRTLHAAINITAFSAIFLAAISLDQKRIIYLCYAILGIALLQAILGLVQYTNPKADWLSWFGLTSTQGVTQGTYRNRDHFSTLMIICLPITIGLGLYSFGQSSNHKQTLESRFNQAAFFAVLMLIIFMAALFSRSRAGVLLSLLAVLISAPVFARHIGGKALGITATLAGLGIGIAASIGLVPVVSRFIQANPVEDARWLFFQTTLSQVKAFFPLGSGPSTFQSVYRTVQPIEQLNFVNHAHNDYIELLLETGAAGMVLLALLLIVYISGWIQMMGSDWDRLRIIKTAAGISLVLFLLHAFLDFVFHTPANALCFVLLAAMFLQRPAKTASHKHR